jgi:hypothetical protein
MGPRDHEKSARFRRRNQIYLRVFRDVPLPTWKIVFPEKLLQFRPLDSARADVFSLAGECCSISVVKSFEILEKPSKVKMLTCIDLGFPDWAGRRKSIHFAHTFEGKQLQALLIGACLPLSKFFVSK